MASRSITVGILGKNSEWILRYSTKSIRAALGYIREKGVNSVEVLYVDGGSKDSSIEVVRDALGNAVRVVDASGTNIPEARNIVVKESSGDYIVYWDSDILAPRYILAKLLDVDKPIVAPERYDVYVESDAEIEALLRKVEEAKSSSTVKEVPFVVFSITLFKREVFDRVGLFDERMTQAEDRDFGIRARCKGYKSYITSDVVYDVNRRIKSDVPITTPLRQYMRGILKKAAIYAYTPSPRQKRNTALFGALHIAAAASLFTTPLFAIGEVLPLLYMAYKYGLSKGGEMWLKSLALYTLMALMTPYVRFRNICKVLEEL
ncbi:putative glycosyltransferase [Pyrobaculum oguniense TE7]|uniref:Glycosyltransferase n=1 Tax=Pyrobaculum oguniense (strain DSM 13380 / JCM 10595 / TE7) TaxID=698757 RepID=H6QB56_PYROT|nr:putative glycosyltransferase [Pyrobaculum oguniense TE7]